ncbi:CAP domain-containing protein [Natrinema sp. 1APR25-10V2]|uniref:CAP domain-containing protein n=1 Tax=Natrinema sp. 1APR25-10V2 TaxID=2951081 RepID=UPI0028760A94|nr:CAP domain-containing protein [Natrinema sp. 1APR25-10V2]MDS0478498.1 CAP domain-containing protein [Natrinema sp. 1APR25-10V2]
MSRISKPGIILAMVAVLVLSSAGTGVAMAATPSAATGTTDDSSTSVEQVTVTATETTQQERDRVCALFETRFASLFEAFGLETADIRSSCVDSHPDDGVDNATTGTDGTADPDTDSDDGSGDTEADNSGGKSDDADTNESSTDDSEAESNETPSDTDTEADESETDESADEDSSVDGNDGSSDSVDAPMEGDGQTDDSADTGSDSDRTDGQAENDSESSDTSEDNTTADETDETESNGLDIATVERHIHDAVNEERTARGLKKLQFDAELRDIAREHSRDMAERGYFSHTDPEGDNFADRYAEAGYECRVGGSGGTYYTGGENIAQTWYDRAVRTDGGTATYTTERGLADAIVTQWMNSPGHRENILASQWEHEGIGVYVTDDGKVYATQNFC